MTEQSSKSLAPSGLWKLVWQAALLVALVAIAWVLAQGFPKSQALGGQQDDAKAKVTVTAGAQVKMYRLPRVGDSAAMQEINARIAAAQGEVIVAARQLAASSLLTNLKTRQAAGVKTLVLLSPDMTADFARSKLFEWIRDNQLKEVYRDAMTSASHIIVIDGKTLIVSDLPFSTRAYEAPDEAAAKNAAFGFVTIIDDERAATQAAQALRARALVQNKIL